MAPSKFSNLFIYIRYHSGGGGDIKVPGSDKAAKGLLSVKLASLLLKGTLARHVLPGDRGGSNSPDVAAG